MLTISQTHISPFKSMCKMRSLVRSEKARNMRLTVGLAIKYIRLSEYSTFRFSIQGEEDERAKQHQRGSERKVWRSRHASFLRGPGIVRLFAIVRVLRRRCDYGKSLSIRADCGHSGASDAGFAGMRKPDSTCTVEGGRNRPGPGLRGRHLCLAIREAWESRRKSVRVRHDGRDACTCARKSEESARRQC